MTPFGCVCCAFFNKTRCAKTSLPIKAARQPKIRTKDGLVQKMGPCGPDAKLWRFIPMRSQK